MSSLGELFFSLGLDSQKFDEAIKKAKEKVAELTGEASITINADASNVAAQVQNDLNKITGKKTEVKLGIDKSSKASVEDLVKDIANAEKELERLKSKESWNTAAIGRQEGFVANLKRQLEEAKAVKVAATEAKEAISNIAQPSQTVQHVVSEEAIADVKALTDAMKYLNEQMEVNNRLREGQQKANAQSKEEAKQRKISAQWLNETRRKNKEIAQLQKEEEAMRSSVSSKWIDEARQKNAELRKEESAAAKQRVADAKTSNKALQSQLSQLFKLEEAIKKLQNLRIRLNFSGIDQNSENFKKAASALDAYINKLQQLQGSGRALSKREVSSVLGMSMKAVIDESDRYVKEQKAIEKSLIKALSEGSGSNVVVDKKTAAMNKFQKAIVGTTNWASQLNNQLGNAFSIYAIERFIRSLYTVGGEFQKQQIALQNMIGDTAKADVIFDRMKDLAVTSPFTFSELASYTKQMSAYGIEYEELYDTTKRLADISAGVGVDMSRIILAYGQVRSAEVLRGQELRQFTEAGIPLVAELAERLEEVRGKSVAVGEVFDAISKREISFDMVKDVLFDMTDPGGRFFETQEKLAESLAGKWSNLKDAWDIMIADIANGNNSTLKSLAEVTAWLVKNWETWLPLITGAAVALGSYRTVMAVVIPLQQAFNILTKANPWIAIASGVLGAAAAIYGYASNTKTAADELKELNLELDKNTQKNREREQTANRYLDSLKAQNTSEEKRIKLLQELEQLYPSIFKGMSTEQVMLADTIELKKRMAEATKDMTLADYDNAILKNQTEINRLRNEDWRRLITPGRGDKHSQNDAEIKRLESINTGLRESREALAKQLAWEEGVKGLNATSTLEDYINLYGEVGKAIKILRDSGIKDESLVKPEQGIPLDEYYDRLNGALQKQKDIMTKFGADTTMHQNAEKIKKVYESAIKSIGGVVGGNQKPTGGKSEAEKAAGRDAKAYLEALKAKLSELGSQWDLYKDLFEATGDKRLSMNIAFDGVIPNFDNYISHLKGLMQEEIQKRGLGISVADLLSEGKEGIAKRVNDKSQTAWTEDVAKNLNAIIDSYNNANKKLREESVRNFIDIIKNSKDFAAQIEDIERNLEKDLKDLRANANGADTSMAEAQLRKNATEAISKVNFEEFKQSNDWIRVFDDLNRVSDATLDNMITKIEEFAKQGRMSEEVTKQIVDAMAKLREETIDRNPFKGFADAWERLKNYKNLKLRVGEYDEHGKLITQKDVDDGIAEANDDLEKAALAIAGKFNAVADAANMLSGVFNGFGDNLESFGGILNGIGSGAKSGAGIASALGIAGPWGAIAGAALGLLSSAFEMHDKAIQKEIEASEARIKMIDNLADNLEKRLSSAEGGIYSISIDPATKKVFEDFIEGFNGWEKYQDSSPRSAMYRKYKEYDYLSKDTIDAMQAAISNDSYYSAQLASLKLQKDELNKQKNDLERAKDIDETKIQDKITEIEQIEHEISVFRKTMMDAIYGIDFKDWASQFTDSIVDAWAKGEDAADAYQRTVSNVMRNVAASVIQQSLIGKWLEDNMENVLALFERNGGVVTDDVFNAMAELASGIGGKVEEVEQFMDYWEKALNKYNLSMKDLESTEKASSGLSKGIQSVTEDTANLLASYVNSMRADLSVNRTLIEQLVSVDVPQMSIIAQAQLQQLQQVAANTKRNADAADRIYELVNKVVDKGSNKLKI